MIVDQLRANDSCGGEFQQAFMVDRGIRFLELDEIACDFIPVGLRKLDPLDQLFRAQIGLIRDSQRLVDLALNLIDVSPDGRHIVFQSQQVLQENIGMIENFN